MDVPEFVHLQTDIDPVIGGAQGSRAFLSDRTEHFLELRGEGFQIVSHQLTLV